ncbi:MAG TPA: aspartate kinase [Elusimicrobia bacterium]|nr:MAG: aspartate kinase [Elusimicrobia bacterium GWD2_63_28]HCC49041.1 aspartate kinase [Elusimicrobiota bacterium]
MALIIQKYGGTSVGNIDRVRSVARRVIQSAGRGNRVVAVVSAMAGETNRLIDLGKTVSKNSEGREFDVLLATGEQVTTALLALAIEDLGRKAVSFLGHQVQITTTGSFSRARIESVNADRTLKALNDGYIVVVAGFQGATREGSITTLGRGGSDITAVALGVALKADRVEFYKDVDGIFTADPSVCPDARLLPKVAYEEMLEMSYLGAKVLHPRCVELARRNKLPLIVRSSLNFNPGTEVVPEEDLMEYAAVAGIVCDKNQVKVSLTNIPDKPGILAGIFTAVAEADINIDMIVEDVSASGGATSVSFTCGSADLAAAEKAAKKLTAVYPGSGWAVKPGLNKLSIVGAGMRLHSGVASRMFTALAREGISVYMVNTSDIKVSCLIEAKYAELAVRTLHEVFELGKAPAKKVKPGARKRAGR